MDCNPDLKQPTPRGLEASKTLGMGKKLLEKKSTGSPTHPSTAAHLQLELWSGHQSLATAA